MHFGSWSQLGRFKAGPCDFQGKSKDLDVMHAK